MKSCPSAFALDDVELHDREPPAELTAHVQQCPRCRARRADNEALRAEFRTDLAAPVWARVQGRRVQLRRRRLLAIGTAVASSVAAAFLLYVRPAPPQRWEMAKGGVAIEAYCRREGRTWMLAAHDRVRAGDELRFRLRGAPAARFVAVGSVDGSGRFSPFYPDALTAESVPRPAGEGLLPGGITIDDAPGPERVFVVLSPRPIPGSAVGAAAEALASKQAPAGAIAGVEVASAWLVLPKQEGGR